MFVIRILHHKIYKDNIRIASVKVSWLCVLMVYVMVGRSLNDWQWAGGKADKGEASGTGYRESS